MPEEKTKRAFFCLKIYTNRGENGLNLSFCKRNNGRICYYDPSIKFHGLGANKLSLS